MQNNQGSDLSVALVADDMVAAKEISLALRKLNVFAYHYQNLEEFWASTHLTTPDLVILDVTKMSQGQLQFSAHPKVVTGKLRYAFFAKESTKILLKSTLSLNPMGYLHIDVTLDNSLKGLLNRIEEEKKNKIMIDELSDRIARLQTKNKRMISERSEAEEFRAYVDQVQNLTSSIHDTMKHTDFNNALIAKLSDWVDIKGFGIYELARDGQRLVSPEISAKNYHPMPSLFLGHKGQNSIESFAKEMAGQVAIDLFEVDPIVLEIKGQKTEMLLYLSFTAEYLMNFPWYMLEQGLTSLYKESKLANQTPKLAGQFLPMWEALDYMDKLNQEGQSNIKALVLDLSPLLKVASGKVTNKFYWSTFYNEFFIQLSHNISASTKLSVLGPWEIIFFVEDNRLEQDSFALGSYVKKFSYWKYFMDQSSVLPTEIYPTLRLSPMSSALYLKAFEKNHKEAEHMTPKTSTKGRGQLTV